MSEKQEELEPVGWMMRDEILAWIQDSTQSNARTRRQITAPDRRYSTEHTITRRDTTQSYVLKLNSSIYSHVNWQGNKAEQPAESKA